MAYDAWTEGYLKAKQSKANKFDPNISIRFERVGNWIVSAKVLGGYKTVICIYHKKTLMEHYKTEQITGSQKAFNNAFQQVFEKGSPASTGGERNSHFFKNSSY